MKELREALESLGFKSKSPMIYSMIEKLNTDVINFDQFLDLMSARVSDIDNRDDLRNVFALFSDGGDYITVDNLLRITQEVRSFHPQRTVDSPIIPCVLMWSCLSFPTAERAALGGRGARDGAPR